MCLCYAHDRDSMYVDDWHEDDCYCDCYEDGFVGDYCEFEDDDDVVLGVDMTNGNDFY